VPSRRYPHFCLIARALEIIGERWALLIVRDLLVADRRFTDLQRGAHGITPRQLSARLKQLELDGIVEQVPYWRAHSLYRLTPAGRALQPVVEELLRWGLRHAPERPRPDEPVSPFNIMNGTRVFLADSRPPVAAPLTWIWKFGDEAVTLSSTGKRWKLTVGRAGEPDVTIETTPERWADIVMSPPHGRTGYGVRLKGSRARVKEFKSVFGLARSPARRREQAKRPATGRSGRTRATRGDKRSKESPETSG
jgi:DNA-binding HxlR family transcriptional regulator